MTSQVSSQLTQALVSIVIVNYNGSNYIEKCLSSVLLTNYSNFEIVIIDNDSKDKSPELISNIAGGDKRVKLVRLENNVGFSEGNNIGVRYSQGKYIALLNPDTEVDPNWLQALVNVAESFKGTSPPLQSRLTVMDTSLIDGIGDFITVQGISFILGHKIRHHMSLKFCDIFSPRAAAMLIEKDLFLGLGGFDTNYFIGYEDVDLGWRIQLAGQRVLLVPDSIVKHIGRASTKIDTEFESFHKHKNCISTVIKNYNSFNMLKYLPATIILRLVLSFSPYERTRSYSRVSLVGLKATTWVFLNLRALFRKRAFVQTHVRKVSDDQILSKMLPSSFWVDLFRWFGFHRNEIDFWTYLYHSMMRYVKELTWDFKLE